MLPVGQLPGVQAVVPVLPVEPDVDAVPVEPVLLELDAALDALELDEALELEDDVECEPVEAGVSNVRICLEGAPVASRDRVRMAPLGYSNVIEGFQVGRSWGRSPAYKHFQEPFPFSGTLRVVELATDMA